MSLTSASSSVTSPSKPVSFPSDLANKIIWSPILGDDDTSSTPTDTSATTTDAPKSTDNSASVNDTPIPKFTFSEGIISEVQAHIALGLSPAAQMGIVKAHNLHLEDKKDKPIKEPLITVLYPRDGCHEIIDAAIRVVGQDQEADVLVIDSLELALGELGSLGKDAVNAIAALYKEPVIPDEEESKRESSKDESAKSDGSEKATEKDASAAETSKDASDPASEKETSEEIAEKDASDSASEASSFEVVSDEKPSAGEPTESNASEESPAKPTGETSSDLTPESTEKKEEAKGETKEQEKKEKTEEEKKEEEEKKKEKDEKKKEEEEKKKEEEEKRKEERIEKEKMRQDRALQDVFDALVDLPPPGKDATKARIIYWRDFGSIAKAAEPLLMRFFRAMHARRTAKFTKDSKSRDLIQPTILVLGDSKWISGERYSSASPRAAFTRGGSALDKLLPFISNYVFTLSNDKVTTELPTPSTGFFLTSLVPSNEDNESLESAEGSAFNGKFELSNFDVSGSTVAIFPEGSDKKEFRKVEQRLLGDRRKVVSNAWLRLALQQCGGTVPEDIDILGAIGDDKEAEADLLQEEKKDAEKKAKKSNDSDSDSDSEDHDKKKEEEKETKDHICKGARLLDQLTKHTDAPLPVALERVVTAAFGLASKPSEDAKADVSISSFTKAYMNVNKNAKEKKTWWKKNKMPKGYYESDYSDDSDDEKEKKDDKKKEEDPIVKKVRSAGDLSRYEERLLGCIVNTADLDTSFDDVCISESTVETLRTIVSLPLLFPTAFKSGVLAKEAIGGVLLYGPPGTGKTLVCRAVSRECGARMLAIKPSDIMDCYVGESEKLVNAVFKLAYRLAPCLIFIDELDSVFRKRQNDDKKWTRDILAEFLQSMDGLRSAKKNKEAGVIVIGATNRPQDIDDAVLRRLPSRMIVDVPSEEEREKILKLHLRGETLEEGITLADIARKTVHYSGSDLKNLCVTAAMASVKEAIGTFSWKVPKPKTASKSEEKKEDEKVDEKKEDEKVDEKSEKKDGEKDEKKDDETTETDAAKERISKRTVKMSHFLQAMNDVPASSASGSHSELRRWHEQFGKKSSLSAAPKPPSNVGASANAASSTSRYGSYASGGAGSTPRYGGYGSGESGTTPRYGLNSGDTGSSSTPRYGSYAAGASSASAPRYGAAASSPGDSAAVPQSGPGVSTGGSTVPRYGAGAPAVESITARYGAGGYSASSYLNGGNAAANGAPGYKSAGLGRYGAGSYGYGGAQPLADEKPTATIEQVVEPDSDQNQKEADSEETKP